ncbi:MAG: FAD binding domain-containing protein [Anaerolineaceae bacterium]|nr:FAD binding domain-containing protein [Anaerolineaceae bacterium]
MSLWSNYVLAESIDEALHALESAPGPALPIAGGTDLLLELQQGRHKPVQSLVDLTPIPELNRLEERDGSLFIGAAVPVRAITLSPLVRENALAVAEACELIGGPQVRNTATLGGNVAHALPAADGMIALCALNAQAEIASAEGTRLEPMLSLFLGPGVSALLPGREIFVGFHIPGRQTGQASAFGRIMRPQGVALPILNLAVWVERDGDRLEDIRIAVGPAGPVPQRAYEIENALLGSDCGPQALEKSKQLILSSLHFRTNPQRASAGYRYQLCEVLLEEIIGKAWKRAEQVVFA